MSRTVGQLYHRSGIRSSGLITTMLSESIVMMLGELAVTMLRVDSENSFES